MKFRILLLFGATALFTFTASAQGVDQKRECKRMRVLAGEGLKNEDYKTATMYFHKAEIICESLDKDDWDRFLASMLFVINEEMDEAVNKLYIDSLLSGYERKEKAGFYNSSEDLVRGYYIMMSANPDPAKADMYFQRGIKAAGLNTDESYIVIAYFATFLMHSNAEGDEKAALKKRMIEDYFMYSEMVAKANFSTSTQESLTMYLNYVFESCEALLSEIPGYISNLPEDNAEAIEAIQRMLTLLETKRCDNTHEHLTLVNAWLERDPESIEASVKKLSYLPSEQGLSIINQLIDQTEDADEKAGFVYQKAVIQLKAEQYKEAYATGQACTGKYEADGRYIAAKAVAATANSCGDNTFERKCNYIYAAHLAEAAGQESVAASYRLNAPSSSDCFNENNPQLVILECWGVSVNPCP